MLEKIAFVMFYGVMALVALTCFIQLGTLRAWSDASWFSAWGSWASGIGTFAAAGVALYISGRDRQDRRSERKQEDNFRRHFAAYRLLLFTEEVAGRLELINVGEQCDAATWTALRAMAKKEPRIEMTFKVTEIPHVMYLGTLCEDGIQIERDITFHNENCRGLSNSFMAGDTWSTYEPMRINLEDIHARSKALGLELVEILGAIYAEPQYEAWRKHN